MKNFAPLILALLLSMFAAFAAPVVADAQDARTRPIVLIEKPADMTVESFEAKARAAFGQAQKVDASVRFQPAYPAIACAVFTIGEDDISPEEFEKMKSHFESALPAAKVKYLVGDEAAELFSKMSSGNF